MRKTAVEKPWRPSDVKSGMHGRGLFVWNSDGIEKKVPWDGAGVGPECFHPEQSFLCVHGEMCGDKK